MAFFRKFFVELIVVAVVVGWAVTKFPDVVTPVIPWLCLAVFWHLIWEAMPRKWASFASRGRKWMVYAAVFVLGGSISILIVYGVQKGIAKLTAAERETAPSESTKVATIPKARLDFFARYDSLPHIGADESGFEWGHAYLAVFFSITNSGDTSTENLTAFVSMPDPISVLNVSLQDAPPGCSVKLKALGPMAIIASGSIYGDLTCPGRIFGCGVTVPRA